MYQILVLAGYLMDVDFVTNGIVGEDVFEAEDNVKNVNSISFTLGIYVLAYC